MPLVPENLARDQSLSLLALVLHLFPLSHSPEVPLRLPLRSNLALGIPSPGQNYEQE